MGGLLSTAGQFVCAIGHQPAFSPSGVGRRGREIIDFIQGNGFAPLPILLPGLALDGNQATIMTFSDQINASVLACAMRKGSEPDPAS